MTDQALSDTFKRRLKERGDFMTAGNNILGIELRFWPSGSMEVWKQTFSAVFTWNPLLHPTHVDRLSDVDAEQPEPWSDALLAEMIRRCAEGQQFSWMLFSEKNEDIGITVARRQHEVEMSMAVPRPTEDLPNYFFGLLDALKGGASIGLGMLFDRESEDAECMMQGLRGVKDISPLLYLDSRALERAGGISRLRNAPCKVIDAPSGGLLLVIRTLVWVAPSDDDKAQIRAVKEFLGISPSRPLILIE